MSANPTARWLAKTMLIVITVMTLTGFIGRWHWLLDLTSHFRLQYLIVQLLFALLFVFIKRPVWLSVMLLGVVINLGAILPLYMPGPSQDGNGGRLIGSFRILHMNVFKFNSDHQRIFDRIREVQPDFVSLVEFDDAWEDAAGKEPLLNAYPYRLVDRDSDLAIFSNRALNSLEVIHLDTSPRDAIIIAVFRVGDEPAALLLTHPKPPVNAGLADRQKAHIKKIIALQKKLPENMVVCGDLNMTSWSVNFDRLIRKTGLRDTRQGYGLQPTWPVHSPVMMIPIDHCLASDRFATLSRQVGPPVGSDHLPVNIELGLRADRAESEQQQATR